jgi:hypothetical protein
MILSKQPEKFNFCVRNTVIKVTSAETYQLLCPCIVDDCNPTVLGFEATLCENSPKDSELFEMR